MARGIGFLFHNSDDEYK